MEFDAMEHWRNEVLILRMPIRCIPKLNANKWECIPKLEKDQFSRFLVGL